MFDIRVDAFLFRTKLVQSYVTLISSFAAIILFLGSSHDIVFILFAPSQLIFKVHAQVFAVLASNVIVCPLVYAVSAGVRAIT